MVGDGSAMYTLQSLWTQAREGLNVLTIVFANRIYQILRGEFDGVGAGEPGRIYAYLGTSGWIASSLEQATPNPQGGIFTLRHAQPQR